MTQDTETPNYAGPWLRLAANILDQFVVVIFMIVAFFVAALIAIPAGYSKESFHVVSSWMTNWLPLIFGWLYWTLAESSLWQATLGKRLLKLKVVNIEGSRISWAQSNKRFFSKLLSALPLFGGYMMIAFTAKKQGLHDKLAGTYVVKNG